MNSLTAVNLKELRGALREKVEELKKAQDTLKIKEDLTTLTPEPPQLVNHKKKSYLRKCLKEELRGASSSLTKTAPKGMSERKSS